MQCLRRKSSKSKHLLIQRSRWFSAHYHFAFKYFFVGWQKFFLNGTLIYSTNHTAHITTEIHDFPHFNARIFRSTHRKLQIFDWYLRDVFLMIAKPWLWPHLRNFTPLTHYTQWRIYRSILVTLIHAACIAKPSQKAFTHTPHHDLDTEHQ